MTVQEIEINGTKFPVRYDVNALSEFETITGKNYFDAIQNPDMNTFRGLAYVGLKCGHEFNNQGLVPFNKTLQEVGRWVPTHIAKDFLPIALRFTIGKNLEDTQQKEGANQGE